MKNGVKANFTVDFLHTLEIGGGGSFGAKDKIL